MKPILEINGLWKEYQRGALKNQYLSLRDNLFNSLRPQKKKETFWALQDINFNVNQGDSLAIIGKNGAGKSTLLKILSKITPPTKGEMTLRGRLASLLEVGTGFHPELTGRENIYLNGSILGLGRKEINVQYDAIVDFSGVEKFLETPLKHYSSGMQLRLAFAVAAHLEPEILVIDEVLAVGDSAFQQKCIDKMTEVSQSGRTILFVSHNLTAVQNLCRKAILLENGELKHMGGVDEIIQRYNSTNTQNSKHIDLRQIETRRGIQELKFKSLLLSDNHINVGDRLKFNFELEQNNQMHRDIDFGLAIQNQMNSTIHHFSNRFINESVVEFDRKCKYGFEAQLNLKPGAYNVVLFVRANDTIQDWITIPHAFEISESNKYQYNNSSEISGLVQPEFSFLREKFD